MTNTFHARFINKENFDPGLYLRFTHQKSAILFDLPDLSNLSPKEILRIEDVFVTHTHMDHFIGFDQMLRISLGKGKTINIFGPEGIIENVNGKLKGYTWNLIENYEGELRIVVNEIMEKEKKVAIFSSKKAFRKQSEASFYNTEKIISNHPNHKVYVSILDHLVPSLGFMLEERFRINILKEKLHELKLRPGPWLTKFKQAIYEDKEDTELIVVKQEGIEKQVEKCFTLRELKQNIAKITSGTRIVYLTDIVGSEANIEQIVKDFGYCDVLFIEAGFLAADKDYAKRTFHLTTMEAGRIAGLLGAKHLHIFHHSFRYKGKDAVLLDEVLRAYRAFCKERALSRESLEGSKGIC